MNTIDLICAGCHRPHRRVALPIVCTCGRPLTEPLLRNATSAEVAGAKAWDRSELEVKAMRSLGA